MDDLYSAGLRIDPAYLLGIAVFDTDHAYLLYVETKKNSGAIPQENPAVMAPLFDAHQFF